ncbi:MAG: hypothetical protein J0L64_06520 [Acidobacteria bacterium]|nr:hypothetical protein [Acidobacteriota bacterium]
MSIFDSWWSASRWNFAIIPAGVWLLSLPAAELAFRLAGDRPTTELEGLYEEFGSLSYKHRAHVVADADWIEGRFSVATDAYGLRCSRGEAGPALTLRNLDLLLLGDSQGYGQGLEFEQTISGVLSRLAARRAMSVGNASVGGHYLENQFELLRWLYTRGVRPRSVLILMTPYLVASSGRLNRAHVDARGRLTNGAGGRRERMTLWLKTHTVVYTRLRNSVRGLIPLDRDREAPLLIRFYSKQFEPDYRARLISFLDGLARWTTERGMDLVLVYTPLAAEMEFAMIARAARERGIETDSDMLYRTTAWAAGELGVPVLDLRPVLERARASGQPLTLLKDPHYNAAVSAACAEAIWSSIDGERARPRRGETPASRRRYGVRAGIRHAARLRPDEFPDSRQ